jgi:HSP20 family protein
MKELYFGIPLFNDVDRLQQQIDELFGAFPSSIRSRQLESFPAINIGSTENSVEIVAFAPGIDPKALSVTVDNGVLTLSGERAAPQREASEGSRTYAQERYTGAFRRVVELPQNVDSNKVTARYINGCVTISVGKAEASMPKAIAIN